MLRKSRFIWLETDNRMILSLNMSCGSATPTTTERATSSAVFARDKRKSPSLTSYSGLGVSSEGSSLLAVGSKLPQDTALTFKTPQWPGRRGEPIHVGLQPASLAFTTAPSRTHSHPTGNPNGFSSSPISANGLSRLI